MDELLLGTGVVDLLAMLAPLITLPVKLPLLPGLEASPILPVFRGVVEVDLEL